MGFQQITLNTNNFIAQKFPGTDLYTISNISDIEDQSSSTTITNNDNNFFLKHTFDEPQYINRITLNMGTNTANNVTLFVTDINGNSTNETFVPGTAEVIRDINQPETNPIKYKSFQFTFLNSANETTTVIDYINVFIPDNIDGYSFKDYNVEFDDSLLDLAGWKNSRFEGSKLTGVRRNQFNKGDVSYGLNPVIEQKTACIFLGKDIDEGDALDRDTPLTEIMNHSYLTVDKILFINTETDDVEIIARENMDERAFNRLVSENFPEGSSAVVKSLEDQQNKLKPRHFVKFNQGQLMKVYSYIANDDGFDDGVFGGHEVYEHKGSNKSIVSGSGLFGFGQSALASSSLFNTESIQFTTLFPAELSFYEGNYSTATMGSQLVNVSASISSSNSLGSTFQEAATDAFGKSVDDEDTSGGDDGSKFSDIRLKENIIYLRKSISGIPIYTFNYIGRKERYVGTMAQDLIKLGRMDAIKLNNNGYYSVYYDKIDVNFNII